MNFVRAFGWCWSAVKIPNLLAWIVSAFHVFLISAVVTSKLTALDAIVGSLLFPGSIYVWFGIPVAQLWVAMHFLRSWVEVGETLDEWGIRGSLGIVCVWMLMIVAVFR